MGSPQKQTEGRSKSDVCNKPEIIFGFVNDIQAQVTLRCANGMRVLPTPWGKPREPQVLKGELRLVHPGDYTQLAVTCGSTLEISSNIRIIFGSLSFELDDPHLQLIGEHIRGITVDVGFPPSVEFGFSLTSDRFPRSLGKRSYLYKVTEAKLEADGGVCFKYENENGERCQGPVFCSAYNCRQRLEGCGISDVSEIRFVTGHILVPGMPPRVGKLLKSLSLFDATERKTELSTGEAR